MLCQHYPNIGSLFVGEGIKTINQSVKGYVVNVHLVIKILVLYLHTNVLLYPPTPGVQVQICYSIKPPSPPPSSVKGTNVLL